MTPDSDLLRPSLSSARDIPAPVYSVRAAFITSFFGGPVAAVLITLLNARRLRRLSRDWPIVLAAPAILITLRWAMSRHALGWVESILGQNTETLLMEISGMVLFGIGYALHAPYHRSQSFLGLPTPNGLLAGCLCILAAAVAEAGLILVIPS